MKILRLSLFAVCLSTVLPLGGFAVGWEPLFDGKSLGGWTVIGDQKWAVEKGAIKVDGTGKEMGWLVSDKSYSNFILRLRFKWTAGNSGIQVRSRLEGTKMIGYQANLDPGRSTATGSILDENGRGMLQETKVKAENNFRKGEWNEYEISAIGDHIVIHVNGDKMVDIKDPKGDKKGIIALQMGAGAKGWMAWSDIRILEIPNKRDWVSLYNGKDLTGWLAVGDGTWKVEDGIIHGKSRAKDGDYAWLVSPKEYTDFHFSTRFKMPSGNSGIQFRSWPVEKMIHGFQADMASGSDWISGHLYDQSEKGILVKPKMDTSELIDYEGWNTYEITAIGPKVELFLNGIKTVEHSDPTRLKGIFAFQLHSGMMMETFWDDIRIIPMK